MKIFITGSTGFLGRDLTAALLEQGHEIVALVRSRRQQREGVRTVVGDGTRAGSWQQEIAQAEVIINLAGENIAQPWTSQARQAIYDSRVVTTQNIVAALAPAAGQLLINASAIGYYGFRRDEWCEEEQPSGDDFLASVARDWEACAREAEARGAKVFIARLGVILGPGGALENMITMFRRFLGARIGSGRQWFSWIHIEDLIRALQMAIAEQWQGTFNLCSPNPVRNSELTSILAKSLHVPRLFPVPAFVIKMALGEMGTVILEGQRVSCRKLLEHGFSFDYTSFEQTVEYFIHHKPAAAQRLRRNK